MNLLTFRQKKSIGNGHMPNNWLAMSVSSVQCCEYSCDAIKIQESLCNGNVLRKSVVPLEIDQGNRDRFYYNYNTTSTLENDTLENE